LITLLENSIPYYPTLARKLIYLTKVLWGGSFTTPIQGFANKKINKIIP
jgi:hypothetical protein